MESTKDIKVYLPKILFLFVTVLVFAVSVPILSQAKSIIATDTIDGYNINIYSDNTAGITGYHTKEVKKLNIPNRIGGIKVVKIEEGAFAAYKNLEEVTLPNTLTNIEPKAFRGCIKLKSITIPGTVKAIESQAFYFCTSLEEVYILYGVQSIGEGAFSACSNLKKVSFASAKDIDNRAFNKTASSLEFETTSEIKELGFTKEDGTKPKMSSVSDNSPVVYEYTIDEKTGEVLIEGYHGDSKQPTVPAEINGGAVTGIGEGAFENKPVTTVKLPSTITTIGANAFAGTGLKDIEIPSGVTAIGSGAFDDDANLEIKGSCEALDEFLADKTNIQFIPYGPGKSLYYELKTNTSPELAGNIIQPAARDYRKGFKLDIKAVPKQGYRFKGWTTSPDVTAANIEIPNMSVTKFTMPDKDVTLTANFEQIPPEPLVIRNGVVLADYGYGIQVPIPLEWGINGQEDPNKTTVHTIGSSSYNYGQVFYTSIAQKVIIPKTITTIHENAFWMNETLKEIIVATENQNFSSIDGVLFNKDQTRLIYYPANKEGDSYTVPDSVREIAPKAFAYNRNLTTINLNKTTKVGHRAFQNCRKLTTITMGSVTTIDTYAFEDCTKLTTAAMDSIQTIGSYAFYYCTSLNNIVIPNTITSIGDAAFYSCSSLSNLTWEEGVKIQEINSKTFEGCNFKELNLPNNVVRLGARAFAYCNKLTTINIPATLTDIHSSSFLGCSSISAFNVEKDNISYSSIDGILFNKAQTILMTYPIAKEGDSYKIPNTVNKIAQGAFSYARLQNIDLSNVKVIESEAFRNSQITSIDLANINSLGSTAFYACYNLTEVTIPASISVLNTDVFASCVNLKKVIVPDTVTEINYGAFQSCTKLTDIVLPEGLKTIGSYAFDNCTSLANINIPSKVTSIGNHAFEDCINLTAIEFPNTLTTIGEYAFNNCNKLNAVTIPSNVAAIGEYAFSRCSNMQTLTFDQTQAAIGAYAFSNCIALTEVIIPNTIKSMGGNVFSYCTNLTKAQVAVNIPNRAFNGCTKLNDVTLKNGVKTIGSYVFNNSKISTLNLPKSVTSIDLRAFSGCFSLAEITADEESESFKGIDGILYNKAATVLWVYPPAKAGDTYVTPDSVKEVKRYAMENAGNLVTVRFGKNVNQLGYSIFEGCSKLKVVTIYNKEAVFESKNTSPYEYIFYGIPSTTLAKLVLEGYLDSTAEREAFIREAQNFKFRPLDEDITQELVINENGTVIGYNGTSKTIVVPSSVTRETPNVLVLNEEGQPANLDEAQVITVNTIGTHAFWNYDETANETDPNSTIQREITNVKLPLSIRTIEIGAFEDCVSLTSDTFKIPEGVRTIKPYAFSNCNSLTEVTLPESVTLVGGNGTPDEATQISVYTSAFYGCKNLKAIKVAQENKNYADIDGVLVNKGKNKIYEVPNGFRGPQEDGNYDIPNGIITIGDNAFLDSALVNVTIPSTIQNIGVGAFKRAFTTDLATVTFKPIGEQDMGIREIENETFKDCTALTSIQLPDTLERLGDSVFDGCTSLTSIAINNNPTYFDQDGVLYAYLKEAEGGSISADMICLVKYPAGRTNNAFEITDNRVKQIYKDAFEGCTNLDTISLNDEIQIIQDNAFNNCTKLENIKWPANLSFIGANAFANTNILNLNLPENVEEIDNNAFANAKIATLVLSSKLKKIADNAFLNSYINEVIIPDSVEFIGNSAFESADLTKVTFEGLNTFISDGAFNGAVNLTVYGHQDSTAQQFAQTKNIPFVLISGEVPEPTPVPQQIDIPETTATSSAIINPSSDMQEENTTQEPQEEPTQELQEEPTQESQEESVQEPSKSSEAA